MKRSIIALGLLSIVFFSSFAVDAWTTFVNKEGRFTVSMPGVPEKSESEITTAASNILVHFADVTTNDEVVVFTAVYSDYPDSAVNSVMGKERNDIFFNGAMEAVAKNVNGTIAKKEVISYKEYPGRHVLIAINDKRVILDIESFLVKNRCYILQTQYMTNAKDISAVKRFYSSFQVTDLK